jgi:hypothetical protein
MHAPHRCIVLVIPIVIVGSACSESLKAPPRPAEPPNFAMTTADGCGASYTMITYEEDSLMATYGVPATQDTISVCETWTGSDYTMSSRVLGSSEFDLVVRDTVEQTSYSNGVVSGFDINGGSLNATSAVGNGADGTATLFSFMNADSATVQASYDSPYYGIASPDEDVAVQPMPSASAAPPIGAAPAADYRRHGLSRRGVRALVNAMDELSRSPTGKRRFRRTGSQGEIITLSVDPVTELVVGEETQLPNGLAFRQTHEWSRTAEGWVRSGSHIESEENDHDHVYVNRSIITFKDVRVNGVPQSAIANRGP